MFFSLLAQVKSPVEVIQNLDVYMADLAQQSGPVIYVLIGLVVFMQTGLVIGPLLPGTTIIFAAGMLAGGQDAILHLGWLIPVCLIGGIVGNHANYAQGKLIGRKIFEKKEKGLVSQESLQKTEGFMEKHGNTAMVVSPFTPFIRSWAPFVAGMCAMDGRRYVLYATAGVVAWVGSMVVAGALLGTIPVVRENIGIVFMGAFLLLTFKIGLDVFRSRRKVAS